MNSCGFSKNRLLELHFNEGSGRDRQTARDHVAHCSQCRDYMATLDQTNQSLQAWPREEPAPDSWEKVLFQLPALEEERDESKPVLSVFPVVLIGLSALACLGFIFLLDNVLDFIPLWQSLKSSVVGDVLGSYGLTALLFFLVGTLITLSMSPVIILEGDRQDLFVPNKQ